MSQQQPDDVESVDSDLDEGMRNQPAGSVPDPDDEPLDFSGVIDRKYWKKDQIPPDDEVELTITDVGETEFTDRDGNPEIPRPLLKLGDDKLFSCNPTNARILAKNFGHKNNARRWIGRRIILWHDPNVTFGNRIIGGLRIRIPKSERGRS